MFLKITGLASMEGCQVCQYQSRNEHLGSREELLNTFSHHKVIHDFNSSNKFDDPNLSLERLFNLSKCLHVAAIALSLASRSAPTSIDDIFRGSIKVMNLPR